MSDLVKQTRLRHVKTQMANFKNLIPYFETSLCADQKSDKNHDDPNHLSRVIAIVSYKKWAKTCLYQRLPSLSRHVRRAVTFDVCNALPSFLYDFLSAYNELSKCEITFLE